MNQRPIIYKPAVGVADYSSKPESTSGNVSFLDRLRSSFFGKPVLANPPPKTPVAVENTTTLGKGGSS